MSAPLKVAVLGSTGSIGRQALDVVAKSEGRVEVVALAAHSNYKLLLEQARRFQVPLIALSDTEAAQMASRERHDNDPFSAVASGAGAAATLAVESGADMVLNALVGAAGLRTTVATLASGNTLALANKESLVVGGEIVMNLAAPGQLLPVDSEHSAIFQCYLGEDAQDVARIWLTASGGPFRGLRREDLASVSAASALSHPTWTMGPKITIDSATLMNKGLEVIEAHHLFGVEYDDIRVVIHPQSCVHSMIEFVDGSVKAHLGAADMRVPIQYAFSHPRRWNAPTPPVDFTKIGALEFSDPDTGTFGCLRLAFEAGRAGGTRPAILNAANEVAVEAFLGDECGFLDIERVVEEVLATMPYEPLVSIEQVEEIDLEARHRAAEELRRLVG